MGKAINYDDLNVVKRNIKRVYRHEKYVDDLFNENIDAIGILQMDESVSSGNSIQPICLPQSPFIDYTGKLATTNGLYNTGTIESYFSRCKAQQIDIPIWSNEECAKQVNYKEKLTENKICAGDQREESVVHRPYLLT